MVDPVELTFTSFKQKMIVRNFRQGGMRGLAIYVQDRKVIMNEGYLETLRRASDVDPSLLDMMVKVTLY